jgi:hypothetical protein
MRIHLLIAILYFVFVPAAWAQTADTASEAAPTAEILAQAPAEEAETGLMSEIEKLRSEMKAVLEETQSGAESFVQAVGAVAADLLGGSGLATIALAAAGGVLGNWIAGAL